MMNIEEITGWLREDDPGRIAELFEYADGVRREFVGDGVHLRGLIEFGNRCSRKCLYCGLRRPNGNLKRFRMTDDEIMNCVAKAVEFGYGTVVLQSGEDPEASPEWIASMVSRVKDRHPGLAVTLSVGEYGPDVYKLWRECGADRYLLRFETSDMELYSRIHPPRWELEPDRIERLKWLKKLGYQTGGGIMVGLPGQTYSIVARDIALFAELDLDMIGIGPYIPNPQTPMGREFFKNPPSGPEQVTNNDMMTERVLALARINCPEANIPATTALATVDPFGYEGGLKAGANVIMPNLTPAKYRMLYEIYPAPILEETEDLHTKALLAIKAVKRKPGKGRGDRVKGPSMVLG